MSTYKVEKYFGHDRGYSCAFRQWGAKSDCRLLHGYSLSFTICLSSSNLTKDNWVYDFGSFDFLKDFLKKTFDHTLLVASDDPEKDQLQQLDGTVANVIILPKISCEMFAEMTFKFIKTYFLDNDIEVDIEYVKVAEHEGNSATYCE